MANLPTKDFPTLVSNMVTAIQGTATQLVDMTIGSVLRAVVEANAAVALWIQSLIISLLATTRAATSSGSDLDSWVLDYGLTRNPAVAASGNVTFTRFSTSGTVVVPVGSTVRTGDGTQTYTVIADVSNGAYSSGLGGYVMNPGTGTVLAKVQAVTAGKAANALANKITVIVGALPGVDTVTNLTAFTNGVDAETDAALRVRFVNYITSRSKATKGAVGYAITSYQSGMTYTLVENQTYSGVTQPGYFYVVIDDGSGAPSGALITAITNAIEAVRPLTTLFGVFAPVQVPVTVTMTLTVDPLYNAAAVKATVQTNLLAYINTLTLGKSLAYSRLIQIAYDSSPGVTNVSATLVNGGTADIAATNQQVIKSSSVTVS